MIKNKNLLQKKFTDVQTSSQTFIDLLYLHTKRYFLKNIINIMTNPKQTYPTKSNIHLKYSEKYLITSEIFSPNCNIPPNLPTNCIFIQRIITRI